MASIPKFVILSEAKNLYPHKLRKEEKGKRFRRRCCSAFRTEWSEAGGASVAILRTAGLRLARLNKIQTAFGFVFGLFDFGYAQDTFASGMLK